MNIRTYTAQETIFATTRLRLPREVNASMDGWISEGKTEENRVKYIKVIHIYPNGSCRE